jgi:hypothetical protein
MATVKTNPLSGRSKELYPLHRGPFLFSPQFLTAADWFQNFSQLIEKVLLDAHMAATLSKGSGSRSVLVKFSNCEMTVDGDGGLFFLDDLGFSDIPFDDDRIPFSDWYSPCGEFPVFLEELQESATIARLGAEHRGISKFSSMLYLRMRHRFESALKQGAAEISACLGSPFAERSSIEAWKLSHLKLIKKERESFFIDDRELDRAVSDDGINIFGLAITPLVTSSAVARTAVTTAKGKRGRKVEIDYKRLNEVTLDLLRKRGVPGPKKPNWTGKIFVKHVMRKVKAGETMIRENLRSIIKNQEKQLPHSGFRQSANSKTTVN